MAKRKITIRGTGNNCLINSFVVYMIAQIRSTSTEDQGSVLVFNDTRQKNNIASSFLTSLTTALSFVKADIDEKTTLNLIKNCDLPEAQLIFGFAMRLHLDNTLFKEPLAVAIPFTDEHEHIEIQPYGDELPADVIPFISKDLGIEFNDIYYETDAGHVLPGSYIINADGNAELQPIEGDNSQQLALNQQTRREQASFCISHTIGGHYDIYLNGSLCGDFIKLPLDYDDFPIHAEETQIITSTLEDKPKRNMLVQELVMRVIEEKLTAEAEAGAAATPPLEKADAAEQEVARAAEQEAARAAEQEAARIAAEQEAARAAQEVATPAAIKKPENTNIWSLIKNFFKWIGEKISSLFGYGSNKLKVPNQPASPGSQTFKTAHSHSLVAENSAAFPRKAELVCF